MFKCISIEQNLYGHNNNLTYYKRIKMIKSIYDQGCNLFLHTHTHKHTHTHTHKHAQIHTTQM